MQAGARIAFRIVAWAVALSAVGVAPLGAQRQGRAWSAAARLQGEVRYDDNPFLLTPGRKQRLDPVSPADSQSERFRDMASATDLIAVPSVEVGVSGPGLFGRTLELAAGAAYEANLDNTRRRHAELDVTIEQSLPHGGRLRLNLDWRPSYFHKNYLRDAVDLSGDGNITPEERVYAAGTSREVDVSLAYRHRLVKSTKRRPLEITGELDVGYFSRSYDAPFPGRSRSGPGAEAGVAVELGRRWTVGVDYSYASLAGDPAREVLILDEAAFGGARDFNANGSFSDSTARAFELVDRSRSEQQLGVSVRGELGKAINAEAQFGRRTRSFSSAEPFDVVNRGRDDTLNEFGLELDLRLVSGLHLVVGGRRAVQRTNRAGDPGATGEVADYTRHTAAAGLRFRF